MSILFSLIFLTLIIIWVQIRTWRVERNIAFPIFTLIFYYWSMAGAWLFTFDNLTRYGKNVGLKYHYLLDKMFPVHLDDTYLKVIWLYGFFIILLQVFIFIGLKLIKKEPRDENKHEDVFLKSTSFAFIALGCLLLSLWIVKDVIIYSLLLNESVYLNIRTVPIPGYVLHQYASWIMIVSLFLYLGLYLRENQQLVKVKRPSFVFWLIFIICNLYLIIIGSRHETFFGGIVVLILMSYPYRSFRKSAGTYSIALAVWLLILTLNDPIRSLMPVIASNIGLTDALNTPERLKDANLFQLDRSYIYNRSKQAEEVSGRTIQEDENIAEPLSTESENKSLNTDPSISPLKVDDTQKTQELTSAPTPAISHSVATSPSVAIPEVVQETEEPTLVEVPEIVEENEVKKNVSLVYQNNSMVQKLSFSVANMVFSNELFAGHFSMYGVLKNDVKPKYGISFKNLICSFVPSTINKERPIDSYAYYSQQMNFEGTQGFTINHITAWYLNASYFGLIIGPFVLSLLLLSPYYLSIRLKNQVYQLYAVIALCCITAFGAMLVRSGPEAFKAVLYESILIPIFIIIVAIFLKKATQILKTKYGR